jgi:hypothetical protein
VDIALGAAVPGHDGEPAGAVDTATVVRTRGGPGIATATVIPGNDDGNLTATVLAPPRNAQPSTVVLPAPAAASTVTRSAPSAATSTVTPRPAHLAATTVPTT